MAIWLDLHRRFRRNMSTGEEAAKVVLEYSPNLEEVPVPIIGIAHALHTTVRSDLNSWSPIVSIERQTLPGNPSGVIITGMHPQVDVVTFRWQLAWSLGWLLLSEDHRRGFTKFEGEPEPLEPLGPMPTSEEQRFAVHLLAPDYLLHPLIMRKWSTPHLARAFGISEHVMDAALLGMIWR